jgi:C1A family cysteine protease
MKIPYKLTHRFAVKDDRDLIFERKFGVTSQSISIKDKILTGGFQIGDQKSEGDCYAWAGKGSKESERILQGKPYVMLSAQSLAKFTKKVMGEQFNEDDGADNKSLFQALRQYGVCEESLLSSDISTMATPLTPEQITNALLYKNIWYYKFKTIQGWANALNMKYVPVLGISVFDSIMNVDKSGIVPLPQSDEDVAGGHDIMVTGVDFEKQLVEFANSWGIEWGANGFGYFPFEYLNIVNFDSFCGE